jgi:hypothetical protein
MTAPGYSPFVLPSSEPQRADKDGSYINNKYESQGESGYERKSQITKDKSANPILNPTLKEPSH